MDLTWGDGPKSRMQKKVYFAELPEEEPRCSKLWPSFLQVC